MFYVTNFRDWLGDTHGSISIDKLTGRRFPTQFGLTKDDIMIIAGDAGFVWDSDITCRGWINDKPFTTLCCLGNHENYDLIEKLPVTAFCGGQAYQVENSLFYAIGGEIYTINGKTFLFINGGESIDKDQRTKGVDWWEQEVITESQIERAKQNLLKYDNKVDYIISHTGGRNVTAFFGFIPTISDIRLSQLLDTTSYSQHFCGHYHKDVTIDNKTKVLYNQIIELS